MAVIIIKKHFFKDICTYVTCREKIMNNLKTFFISFNRDIGKVVEYYIKLVVRDYVWPILPDKPI